MSAWYCEACNQPTEGAVQDKDDGSVRLLTTCPQCKNTGIRWLSAPWIFKQEPQA